jgi:hypothetical protein
VRQPVQPGERSSSAWRRRASTQPRDRLHRIVALGDAGQNLVELAAQPLARDYLRHAGVPPMLRTGQVRSGGYVRPHFPGHWDGTAASKAAALGPPA